MLRSSSQIVVIFGALSLVACSPSGTGANEGTTDGKVSTGDGALDGTTSHNDGTKDDATTRDGPSGDSVAGKDGGGGGKKDGLIEDGVGGVDSGPVACNFCHGNAKNAAPPIALSGLTSTSLTAVGAHQKHLAASNWHAQFYCVNCHIVPKAVGDRGHIDTPLPAELTFSGVAKARAASPVWNRTTCSGTYCHGAKLLPGGKVTSPIWTKLDGSQTQCDSCHGTPPGGTHTTSTACYSCHAAVVDKNRKIITASLHINGKVEATASHPTGWKAGRSHGPGFYKNPKSCATSNCHGATYTGGGGPSCSKCHSGWRKNCVFCHGGALNKTGAPPLTVDNKTSDKLPGVGKHTSHVWTGGAVRYDCVICHGSPKPTDALSPGHIDATRPADIKFTGLGTGTRYNFKTYWCTNIYCHGNGQAGSTGSALWIGNLSGGCGACHDANNANGSGKHNKHVIKKGIPCSACHSCVVNTAKQITNPANHVNGKKNVCGLPSGTYNLKTKTCTFVCHGKNHKAKKWM